MYGVIAAAIVVVGVGVFAGSGSLFKGSITSLSSLQPVQPVQSSQPIQSVAKVPLIVRSLPAGVQIASPGVVTVRDSSNGVYVGTPRSKAFPGPEETVVKAYMHDDNGVATVNNFRFKFWGNDGTKATGCGVYEVTTNTLLTNTFDISQSLNEVTVPLKSSPKLVMYPDTGINLELRCLWKASDIVGNTAQFIMTGVNYSTNVSSSVEVTGALPVLGAFYKNES
jgi:hypothetical protein